MSIKPPSKNHSFPPCPATHHLHWLTWAPKRPSSPNPEPIWVGNSTGTACEPGHHGAGGEASIRLQPPLLTPFPTGHRSLETPVYWEVGKKWLVWVQFGW